MSKYEFQILTMILRQLNPIIEEHGKHVMYIFNILFKKHRDFSEEMLNKMLFLCLYHDIGAMKTEEFVELTSFDVKKPLHHSIYGYLFIKYYSPFQNEAEVLLYHHLMYKDLDKINSKFKSEAILLHLADRIDILVSNEENNEKIIETIKGFSGSYFSPEDVDIFVEAEKECHIIDTLRCGNIDEKINEIIVDKKYNNELTMNYIKMLIYVNDFRCESTVVHTILTISVSKTLAGFMALDSHLIADIQLSALLHDIGKIKVPATILEKPTFLNAEEKELAQKHILYTKEILETSHIFPQNVINTAINHHERLDGSGYPHKLQKESLNISDRILQIADVLSSLWELKPYKESYAKLKVLKILNEEVEKGTLDENIVLLINEYHDYIKSVSMEEAEDALNRYKNLHQEYSEIITKLGEEALESDSITLFPQNLFKNN